MKPKNFVSTTFLIALLTVVLFVGIWQMQIKQVNATTVYLSTGFEDDFSQFTGIGGEINPSITTSMSHAGNKAGNFSTYSAYASCYAAKTIAAVPLLFAKAYVRIVSGQTAERAHVMSFASDGGGTGVTVGVYKNVTGLFWFVEGDNDRNITTAASADTWYNVTMSADATGHLGSLWIDDVLTATHVAQYMTGFKDFKCGITYSYGGWCNIIVDDVAVQDTSYPPETEPTVNSSVIYDNLFTTNHQASQSANFCIRYTNTSVTESICSTNNSGLWVNDTFTAISSPQWHNKTVTLNATGHASFLFYFKLSNVYWASDYYTFPIRSAGDSLSLHVEGNRLVNDNGTTVILRGVNQPLWADCPGGGYLGHAAVMTISSWNITDVRAELDKIQSWGCNVIRSHQAVEHLLYNMSGYATMFTAYLAECYTRGIYVLYDGYRIQNYFHGCGQDLLPYPPYQCKANDSTVIASETAFVNWCVNVTKVFDVSNMLFEPWNEPSNGTYQAWGAVTQQVITAVRGNGSDMLIVAEWDAGQWVNLDYPPSDPSNPASGATMFWVDALNYTGVNLMYDAHMYRSYGHTGIWSVSHGAPPQIYAYNYSDMLSAFNYELINATAQHHPLIVGEFGYNNYASDPANELLSFNNELDILDDYGLNIGYTPYVFRNIGTFAMCDNSYNPNTAGQAFINHLANLTSTVDVTLTSPTVTTYTTSIIDVEFSASGGTIDKMWWNCKNGTDWIYGSNQTYTVPTSMTGVTIGTYIFYSWANNTIGDNGESTVVFTVEILTFTGITTEWGGYWGRWWGYP